jgi:hypothetical protein
MPMTSKADFSTEEWELVREGPPAAGVIALMASGGGTFRETWALAKAFADARTHPGKSELIDALATEKPHLKRYHSREEAEQEGLERLSEAVALLEQKAAPEEVEAYREFTLAVARRVAEAHKEQGAAVSEEEQAALGRISETLGSRATT